MDTFKSLLGASQPSLLERVWQNTLSTVQVPLSIFTSPISFLLNIPGLSFLLIPTFSSYSTSLNLLFFYLTWSTLILSHPPLKVEFIGTLAIRVLFYIFPSIGFLLFDSAIPSLAVNLKEHGDIALISTSRARNGQWWKFVAVSICNVLLGVCLQTGVEWLFLDILHIRSALRITTTLPMPWGIFKDLFRGFVLREILTYTLHRYLLHSPTSPLTPLHTSYYHTLPTPLPFSSSYDHPLAYLTHIFLPTYLPALFFRFHFLTYCLFLALVSIEETFTYSGYNVLPGGFILGGIARRHERHLMGAGRGNFGAWGACDLCVGTSLGGDVLDDVREEVEERHVKERVGRRVRGIGAGKGDGQGGRKRK
jgi:hypothetical protein